MIKFDLKTFHRGYIAVARFSSTTSHTMEGDGKSKASTAPQHFGARLSVFCYQRDTTQT